MFVDTIPTHWLSRSVSDTDQHGTEHKSWGYWATIILQPYRALFTNIKTSAAVICWYSHTFKNLHEKQNINLVLKFLLCQSERLDF